jgi:hypothetical protein
VQPELECGRHAEVATTAAVLRPSQLLVPA